MCVCVMAVAVYSATHNLYLIFKPVLIYCTCNLYKVVKICHKFSMPTVIHCNSVLETHSVSKVTGTLFSYPRCCHGDDEQTRVG